MAYSIVTKVGKIRTAIFSSVGPNLYRMKQTKNIQIAFNFNPFPLPITSSVYVLVENIDHRPSYIKK